MWRQISARTNNSNVKSPVSVFLKDGIVTEPRIAKITRTNPVLVDRPRKKKSQSTLRRDKLRLNRYLEMKRIRRASATTPQSSVTEKSSSESPGSMDHDKHKAGHEQLDLSHNKKLEAVVALCKRAQDSFQQMSTAMEKIDRKALQAGARAPSFPSHDSFS